MISKHNKKKANCFAKSKKPQRPQSSSGRGTSLTSVLLDPKQLSFDTCIGEAAAKLAFSLYIDSLIDF